MKSRIAISFMLVFGLMISGTGGALALSGSSGEVNAAQNQYCEPGSTDPECLPQPTSPTNEDEGVLGDEVTANDDDASVAGETSDEDGNAGSSPSEATQDARQAASDDNGNLPFTGFAAIPVLLLGLLMLGAGVFLSRTTRRTQ